MRRLIVGVLVCSGLACKARGAPATASACASASASAPSPKEPPRICGPLDLGRVARFTCDASVVKAPVPAIEDPKGTLAPFYDGLAERARGASKRRVRIGVYGDSNMTSDLLTGHLRRVLQGRFGDGGHGYVSLSKPWGSYRHQDVEHGGNWSAFHLFAPTTHIARDKQYGFANMAAESGLMGAAAWVGTDKSKKAKVGGAARRFELYYLKQPGGGAFRVMLDGAEVRTIETAAADVEAGFDVVDTEDGPHDLKCVVKGGGPVRLFGASLDREGGLQVDSLGAGSLNFERLHWVADGTRRAQLARRAYDLVVIWLGANVMWVPPNERYAKHFLGELRASLPGVPVLLLSAADGPRPGDPTRTDPRVLAVVEQVRKVAVETDAAFWDLREAMGGEGSMIRFSRRGLTGADHVHFGPAGSALVGDRLLCAMFDGLAARLEKHPEAGCPRAP